MYEARVSVGGVMTATIFFILGLSLYSSGHPNGATVVIMLGILTLALGLLPLCPVSNRWMLVLFVILMVILTIFVVQPIVDSAMEDLTNWLKDLVGGTGP